MATEITAIGANGRILGIALIPGDREDARRAAGRILEHRGSQVASFEFRDVMEYREIARYFTGSPDASPREVSAAITRRAREHYAELGQPRAARGRAAARRVPRP